MRGYAWCTVALATSLSTAAFRLKAGGSVWLKTGSHGTDIGWRSPDISRMLLFSWASTKRILADRAHSGAHRARTDWHNVFAFALHVVPASFAGRLF